MLSDEDLAAIQARMEDSFQKWHILTAQQDLKRLLAEVKRLRKESESDAVPPGVPDHHRPRHLSVPALDDGQAPSMRGKP